MSRLSKGYLIATAGVVLWSTTGVLMAHLITDYHIPPLVLAFWRDLLVSLALLPALILARRSLLSVTVSQTRYFVFYGLALGLFNAVWILSVGANGAAVATVLGYSSAGFTAILAWWLFKEELGPAKLVAVVLSLAGCVMVSDAYSWDVWRVDPLGVSTGLLSGLLFAAYTLLSKGAAARRISSWTSMLYSFAFGALFILALNLFPMVPGAAGSLGALVPQLPVRGWLLLVLLAVGPTLLGFALYNTALDYLPAGTANLLATSEPAMTAVEAYIFLGERMNLTQLIGGAVILSGVLLVRRAADRAAPNHATSFRR